MHDLSDSWRRHARAKEHVAHVERLAETIRSEGKVVLPADSDAESGKSLVQLPAGESAGDDFAVRVGEAIYNFRAALDYAVFAIARGKGYTQFPIENSKEGFEARKTGCLPNGDKVAPYLKPVPDRERDLIEAVQPYKGVDWTERLRAISNRDKHRELAVVNAISGQPFRRSDFPALYPSANLYPGANLFPSDGRVEMDVDAPIDIAFSDGVLVAEALKKIESEVGALLTALEGS
jgi:hypothetical protein